MTMKIYFQQIIFSVAVAMLTAACDNTARGPVKKDGALCDSTTLAIEKVGATDTARAFRMLDSLYEKGTLAEHIYYYTRARVYQGTVDRLLAIDEVRRAYETAYVQQNDTVRAQVLQWMTRLMLPVGHHEECISQAIEGIRLARALEDPIMEADFMMLIGMSYYDMGDKPHAWEKMNEAMEYAEQFESQEKSHEIQLQQRRVFILCVIVMFSVVVLVLLAFFMRRIQLKNRDLQNVISSLEQKQKIVENIRPSVSLQPQGIENDDLQKFLDMERIITDQKLYLNPAVSIDVVMEQAGYNRRTSTKLIQQFSSTNTRLDYLNQKRVEYAAHLLLSEQSLSSKEVGERSGFYDDSTFRRNFKKYFGVTPTAYRAIHANS